MSLQRALQLHTAVLAALGVLFVGLGQENPTVPIILALAIVAAVLITDILQVLRLNRLIANLLALVAVVWSLKDFFLMTSDSQLVAIANMLGYLQIVLLFQEKSARIYWQLLVLSLLQVVVAAALDLGPEFAMLLAVYVIIGLSTLMLLCIYRDTVPPAAASQTKNKLTKHKPLARPPHAGQQLLAPPQVAPTQTISADGWLNLPRGLIGRQVALLTVVSFVFAAVFFYASPRLGADAWNSKRSGGGFSGSAPQIRLAEAGRIHLSSQVAMRVVLLRQQDDQPAALAQDPYFHGAVLTEYVADENGYRWLPRKSLNLTLGQRPFSRAPMQPLTSSNLVRQEIVLEHAPSNVAYAIMPVQDNLPSGLGYSRYQNHLFRTGTELSLGPRQQRYTLLTPAIRSGRQLHGVPHNNPLYNDRDQAALDAELAELLKFDAERFPRLAQTAAEVIERLDLTDASPLDKATALERHFRTSPEYEYTLNLDFQRDRDLDPIEDFIANHKRGHCEYYASALALMLRSQDIPSRIVIGYKGGVYNSLGKYYAVQQRFAHAWVEAWMAPGAVPEDEVAGRPSAGGCWYRLDPTPGRAVPLTGNDEGVAYRLAQAFDYVELLWRDYVLTLNQVKQRDALYEPLSSRASVLPAWVESRRLQNWLRGWTSRLGLDFAGQQRGGGRRVFEGSLALLVAAALLGVVVLVQIVRLAARAIGSHWRPWRSARLHGAARQTAFYARLEKMLARLPLCRQSGQTPRELAGDAAQRLAASDHAAVSAALPGEIVAAYYRVRFGGHRLDKNETAAIEQALAEINRAVRQQNRS